MVLGNIPIKVMDNEVMWDILKMEKGWKLEQNIFTGHARILNPDGVRVAWGSADDKEDAFDRFVKPWKGCKKEVTKRLMKSWDYELHLRRDIREELEAEVRQEVRQEVAKEVRQEVAEEDALNLIRFCHENGVTDDAIRENLADKYGYDDASIDTLFEKAKAPAAKA